MANEVVNIETRATQLADKIENLASCFQQLQAMQDDDNERRAAGLYRAMFRHETDTNKLDWDYADHILGYAEMGSDIALEDYKNYLQYLKCINKEEYLAHKEMLDSGLNPKEEEEEE